MSSPPPAGVDAAMLTARLRAALGDEARLDVINESHLHAGHAGATQGSHWRVVARGACFAGLSPLARHRRVQDAVRPLFEQGLHALSIDAQAE